MKERDSRLFSLDALRGLDMLFLCVVQPIVVVAAKNFGFSDVETHPFMRQFGHFWGGFTAYDLIMPLFIFMSGAAVPLALKRRLDAEGRPTAAFWKHIGVRFVMLWILGMVAQGRASSTSTPSVSPRRRWASACFFWRRFMSPMTSGGSDAAGHWRGADVRACGLAWLQEWKMYVIRCGLLYAQPLRAVRHDGKSKRDGDGTTRRVCYNTRQWDLRETFARR